LHLINKSVRSNNFVQSNLSRIPQYAVVLIVVAIALAVREVLIITVTPHDFLLMLPLMSVYVACAYGGEGPGLLSIGLVLLGVNLPYSSHGSSAYLPRISSSEQLFLEGLFALLSFFVWYLASASRKSVERARISLVEQERTIKQLKDFLSTMSHDLRSPLNSLNLCLYTLERMTENDNPQCKRPFTNAHRQVAKILSLIERLLEPIRTSNENQKVAS
jgi:signal transduction histidine kinase